MRAQRERSNSGTRLGNVLREWRALRGASQLSLAEDAEISQRHLSFIESGRAKPSREMILKISEALDLPLRARNDLLVAAGFVAIYPERPLSGPDMERAREVLERILTHHEPYPAMVLDRSWNIVMKNKASSRIFASCLDEEAMRSSSPDGQLNFMRMMFAEEGMRPRVRSWDRTASVLLSRLRREAAAYPGSPSESLLRDLRPAAPPMFVPEFDDEPLSPAAPLELQIGEAVVRLFNTITTFGTPQDVTLQELRIEMSFPMDDASDAYLRACFSGNET